MKKQIRHSCFLLAWLLVGCQASLDLDAVNKEIAQSVHRFDQLQAITSQKNKLIAVGSGGVVITSLDKGQSWSRTELEGHPPLIDITVCPNGEFYLLDMTRSVWFGDGEKSWQQHKLDTAEVPLSITCDFHNRVWVSASFSTLLMSEDNAQSWKVTSFDEDLMLNTIQFINQDIAVTTGEFGTVLFSYDGGESWQRVTSLPDEFYPQATQFIDPLTGWVVGLNGNIFFTKDGAKNWSRYVLGDSESLYGITAVDNKVLFVGDHSVSYVWQDSAAVKLQSETQLRDYLRGVTVLDDGSIYVAGGSGTLTRLDVKL